MIGIKDPFSNPVAFFVNVVTVPIAFTSALFTNIYETITGTEKTIWGNQASSSTNSYPEQRTSAPNYKP